MSARAGHEEELAFPVSHMIMLALGLGQTNGAQTFVEGRYVSVERVDHKFTSTTEQISAVMPTKAVSLYILLLG